MKKCRWWDLFIYCGLFNDVYWLYALQAGLQQIVEDQQKMILHLEAELKRTISANSELECRKVYVSFVLFRC